MSEPTPANLYEWPDDYFRSERVFRVARATNNLYRQMRISGLAIEDALRFESAVISMAEQNPEDTPVNWTNYKPLERIEGEAERKQLLESIKKEDLSRFLKKQIVQKHCDPCNIAFLQAFCEDASELYTPKEVEDAYLELVALYSRVPVNGYAAKMLNEQYFGSHSDAAFFLVYVAPQDKDLGLLTLWSCTPKGSASWNAQRVLHNEKQTSDPNIVGEGERDDFFIKHLMRVVRLQEFDASDRNPQKRGKPYHLIAIPLRTLHKSSRDQSAGTFLGWLFVHCPEWNVKVRRPGIKKTIEPIVEKLWPLLDDYASSLLDGEIEERLSMFGRVGSQDPLQFIKDQITSLSGWECVDDPPPKDVRGIHYYKSEGDTLLLVLTPAQSGRETVAIRLRRKPSTRIPKDRDLLRYGSKRFCQRIRSFYEQAKLRFQERLNAQKSGFLESAHDYSKDLNAIDSTFGRLSESIEETANSIRESLSARPELTEFTEKVKADLAKLARIRDYSLLRPRFMMAHARTQTEGYYYEQPDWLVQRLVNATRGDIDFIVRLLVWEPLGSRRYLELVEMAPQNTEVSEWSRLFAYDEVGRHPAVDALLSAYLKRCFLRPPENGGPMSPEEFGRLHPPPALNSDRNKTDVLLPGLRERTIGIRGLLPLLVFSLRAAFQHAWLTSFVKAALRPSDSASFCPMSEAVTISEDVTNSSYSLRIEFPNPLSVSIRERIEEMDLLVASSMPTRLPWGNWEREISFYSRLGLPWTARITNAENGNTFRLEIIASC